MEPHAETLFNPQRLDLASVSAEVILELEKLWLGRNVEIRTDIPIDLPKVFADQRRMRQVLLNLLENALKYTGNGGHITLTMLHRTSQWVEVSVCDSGPGIPSEEQQRIFWIGCGFPRHQPNHRFRRRTVGLPSDRGSSRRTHLGGVGTE